MCAYFLCSVVGWGYGSVIDVCGKIERFFSRVSVGVNGVITGGRVPCVCAYARVRGVTVVSRCCIKSANFFAAQAGDCRKVCKF